MTEKELQLERRIRELEAKIAAQREAFTQYLHENGPYPWDLAEEIVDRILGE